MIKHLDFRKIPNAEFNMATCSELYDEYLAEYHEVPDEIWITAWQQMMVPSPKFEPHKTWRGVPMVVK